MNTTTTTELATAVKTCGACGKDVTHERRMRDSKGGYWCYECGSADQARKGPGVKVTCPGCRRALSPKEMIKAGAEYVCGTCHAAGAAKGGRVGPVAAGRKRLIKVVAGIVMLAIGAILLASQVGDVRLLF
jgi:hypothetical protein